MNQSEERDLINSLRGSESHFRLMADLMPAKISNAKVNGEVIYFSKAWLDFTGMGFQELKDFGYHQIMHPEEIEEFKNRLLHAAVTRTTCEMEMRFMNKTGEYVWHLNRAAPVIDEFGEITMWIGVTADITDQIKIREGNKKDYELQANILEAKVLQRTKELNVALETLSARNEELSQQNKNLDSFTYVSSHDLQEPLRKIQMLAKRLLEKEIQNLSPKGQDYFERIQKSSTRMQKLIDDLLSYSRITTGEKQHSWVNLSDIIKDALTEFKEIIDDKSAVIETNNPADVWVIPFQFHQLISNIIGNALKFSKSDTPPHIVIEGRAVLMSSDIYQGLTPGLSYYYISIRDNGIGFEQEYAKQIFDVFQRLHGREDYPGTGIGLSIAQKVVDNHKGYISATGEPGVGSRFEIYIPLPL